MFAKSGCFNAQPISYFEDLSRGEKGEQDISR